MRKLGVAAALLLFATGTNAAAQEAVQAEEPSVPDSVLLQEVVTIPETGTTSLTSAGWTTYQAERREAPQPLGLSRTLLYTGAGIFLGTYAASAFTGAVAGTDGDRFLLVPVVGPWIALGTRSTTCGIGDCDLTESVNTLGIITSGALQAAGIGLMIASFFVSDRFGRF